MAKSPGENRLMEALLGLLNWPKQLIMWIKILYEVPHSLNCGWIYQSEYNPCIWINNLSSWKRTWKIQAWKSWSRLNFLRFFFSCLGCLLKCADHTHFHNLSCIVINGIYFTGSKTQKQTWTTVQSWPGGCLSVRQQLRKCSQNYRIKRGGKGKELCKV